MTHVPVADILQGKHAVGTTLTVKGWIRTRRDSKAGIRITSYNVCYTKLLRAFGVVSSLQP